MSRDGMNPSRARTTDYHPARVTVAVLTHVPHESGYFQNRFEVTRMTIESILANTTMPYDLMVFDNGSCPQVVDYLREKHDAGDIQYLILSSQNIGKMGALQMIFRAAQGEIVAYTDDDVFFLPGWLEAHVNLIDTYPNVGAVTGFYIRERMRADVSSTLTFLNQTGVTTERGLLIPRSWEEEYMENSGRSRERYDSEVAGLEDIKIHYQGVDAWVSAHHYQFAAKRSVILNAIPQEWTGKLMGQMVEMDHTIDQQGYLRLCTADQTVRLMGNVLDEAVAQLAAKYGISAQAGRSSVPAESSAMTRFYRMPLIHRVAQGLYNRLYKIINA